MGGCALAMRDVVVSFPEGRGRRVVLNVPSLQIASGSHLGIRGASGSGKSTLLHVLSGLLVPDQGSLCWGDTSLAVLSEAQRDLWRGQHVGFVFQDFRLFPGLNALENILFPVSFFHWRIPAFLRRRAQGLMERLELPASRRVELLSRGEQQRVAIARAVLREPEILLADEPTASLDSENAQRITELLLDIAIEQGSTLLVVSHDEEVLSQMERTAGLYRGQLGYCKSESDLEAEGSHFSFGCSQENTNR